MPVGISVPGRISTSGGVALNSTRDQDDQIIRIALGDGSNDNPWQQSGVCMGSVQIFSINDSDARSLVVANLIALFNAFEAAKRFKLIKDTINWPDGDEGDMILEFKYVNLETDEVKDFQHNFLNGGA